MFCENCGSQINDGFKFCMGCGAPVKAPTPARSPYAPADAVDINNMPAEPTPVEAVLEVVSQPESVVEPTPVEVVPEVVPQPEPVVETAPVEVVPQPIEVAPVSVAPASPVAPSQPQQIQVQTPSLIKNNFAEAQAANIQPMPEPVVDPKAAQKAKAPKQKKEKAPKEPKQGGGSGKKIAIISSIIVALLAIAAALCIFVFDLFGIMDSGESRRKAHANKTNTTEQTEETEPEETEPEATPTPEPEPDKARTLMIYVIGSNLESPTDGNNRWAGTASSDIEEMLEADIPDTVNVILECGGATDWVNPNIPDNKVTRFKIEDHQLVMLEDLGRTSMTENGALSDFIEYSSENYPADSYVLLLWDHGGGIPIGFGMDLLGDPNDMVADYEIQDELQSAGVHFELVAFDACNMGTLEMGMALKDNCDYMVGAESVVNGCGLSYTNWMSMVDQDVRDFSEVMVRDYMSELHSNNIPGSMSLIRLDMMDEVYGKYVDYIAECNRAVFTNGDYANYVRARCNCGEYEGTDSVDIINLATLYENSKSTALINSIVSCVVYTESDIAFGHGLTAYAPAAYPNYYTDGRESFTNMGYDNEVIQFYDRYASVLLASAGDQYVQMYAGDWYDADIVDAIVGGHTVENVNADLIELDDYYALELSEEQINDISTIELALVTYDDESEIFELLGTDYTWSFDSENRLALVDPTAWTYVNGQLACYIGVDSYSDDDTWYMTGTIPAMVNDEFVLLYVYYDENYPQGTIRGYVNPESEDESMMQLLDDDSVDLVHMYLTVEGEVSYEAYGSPIQASQLSLSFEEINLDEVSTFGYYTITDVYGNETETDLVPLGYADSVA